MLEPKLSTVDLPSSSITVLQQKIIELTTDVDEFTPLYQNTLDATAQLCGEGLLASYYLSQATARALLCRDRYGYLKKTNRSGNHAVASLNGLHAKPNPVGIDFICPAMEFAMYRFYALLGENGEFIAPTTLVKVSGVEIEKIISKQCSPPAWNQVDSVIKSGQDLEMFLDNNPSLKAQIITEPEKMERVIQVGQTAEGISLLNWLSLLKDLPSLESILGRDVLLTALPQMVQENYLEKFYTKYPELKSEIRLKPFFDTLSQIMVLLTPQQRLLEFEELDKDYEDRLQQFKKFYQRHELSNIAKGVGIVFCWPVLAKNQPFVWFVKLAELMQLLPKIWPGLNAEGWITATANAIQQLDPYNFAVHFIGNLLTDPVDGKPDNYIVVFERDHNGNMLSWHLVGIDNDKALANSVVSNSKGEHYIATKSIMYCLATHLEAIDPIFRHRLLTLSPQLFLLQWLAELYQLNLRYARLCDTEQIRWADRFEAGTEEPTLDIPLRLDPQVTARIYQKIIKIQGLLALYPGISFQDLLLAVDPIVALWYQRLNQLYPKPLDAIHHLYRDYLSLEQGLEPLLSQPLPVSTFIEDTPTLKEKLKTYLCREQDYELHRTQSIEDAISVFIKQYLPESNQKQLLLDFIAEHFSFITELSLSPKTLNLLLMEAVRDNNSKRVDLLLRCGADINLRDEAGRTPLHIAVQLVTPDETVIKRLLQEKNLELNAIDQTNYTALFYLADRLHRDDGLLFRKLFILLLQAGFDIELRDPEKQQTVLDKAIQKNRLPTFITLIELGAGRSVDVRLAWDFIKQYQQQAEWRESMNASMRQLMQQSNQFAWYVGFQTVTDPVTVATLPTHLPKSSQLIMDGAHSGKRILSVDVVKQLFDINGDILSQNNYGRRQVAFVHKDEFAAHFKFFPEMPGVEEAVRALARCLFAEGNIAETELFQFNYRNKSCPVLISQHIVGENLQEIMKDTFKAKLLEQLDNRSFTESLFLAMLINPEDGKPDNYVLSPFINAQGQNSYRILGIDNDHAFVDPVRQEKGHRVLQVKTILYCLDQMLKPLDKYTIKVFLRLQAKDVIKRWLKELIDKQRRYDELFPVSDRKRLYKQDKENPIIVRILFKSHAVSVIYEKFMRMQSALSKNPDMTGLQLLRQTIPLLGIRYEEAFKKINDPAQRFRDLFAQQYSTAIADRYGTLVTGKQLLASMAIPEMAAIEKEDFSPQQSWDEFQKVLQESSILQQAKENLSAGNTQAFQELLLDSSRETVLKSVEIAKLDSRLQKTLFGIIEGVSLTTLEIKNCTELKESQFRKIVESSPNLTVLDASGCQNLTHKIGRFLERNCPALERLDISELSQLKEFQAPKQQALAFPALKHIWLANNPLLQSIYLQSPALDLLAVSGCTQLQHLNIIGNALCYFYCEQTPKLEMKDAQLLIANSANLLRSLNWKGSLSFNSSWLAWHISAYHQWNAANLHLLIADQFFNCSGLPIIDEDLKYLMPALKVGTPVDVRGCTSLSLEGLLTFLPDNHLDSTVMISNYYVPSNYSLTIHRTGHISALMISPQGEVIAATQEKTLKRWTAKGEYCNELTGHTQWVLTALLLPNGQVVTGSNDKTIRIWDMFYNSCVQILKGHARGVNALLHHQGILVSSAYDRTLKWWDLTFAKTIRTLAVKGESITVLTNLDQETLVSGAQDGILSCWNIQKGSELESIQAHRAPIYALKRVATNCLASSSSDQSIALWSFFPAQPVRVLKEHTGPVTALAVLMSGHLFASGSADKTVKIWDVHSGECVQTLDDYHHKITALAIAADGALVAADEDGNLTWLSFPHQFLNRLDTANWQLQEISANEMILIYKAPFSTQESLQQTLTSGVGWVKRWLGISGLTFTADVQQARIVIKIDVLTKAELLRKLFAKNLNEELTEKLVENTVEKKQISQEAIITQEKELIQNQNDEFNVDLKREVDQKNEERFEDQQQGTLWRKSLVPNQSYAKSRSNFLRSTINVKPPQTNNNNANNNSVNQINENTSNLQSPFYH